jgi:hypothetical protein
MWGSDYPHPEGCYQYPRTDDEASMLRLALRDTFSSIPTEAMRLMAGGNATRVFGFDPAALTAVAERIAAPTVAEIQTPVPEPIESPSTRGAFYAFRRHGPWH